jgi:microcystin-dependent protein
METPPILFGKDTTTGTITQLQTLGNVLLTTPANPIGTINMYASTTVPSGWLLCDGSAVSRTTYSSLFNIIGTTYGVGDNSTTFNIPNLQNRMPICRGTGSFATLGSTGGAETYTLTTTELPAHTHYIGNNSYGGVGIGDDVVMTNVNNTMYLGGDFGNNTDRYRMSGSTSITANAGLSSSTGTGTAFNKMSPYIVINFIIYTGVA